VTAVWGGGVPYYTSPQRNITVSVVERTTVVEIISPPSSTQYLDNVTFTFRYTDTVDSVPILTISASDIDIYSNGTLLNPGDFVMIQLGSLFEVAINSTILSSQLVDSFNITIVIDWNAGTAPYYEDALTALRVSTIERIMFVEVGTIDITPKGDNITISFLVSDDASGAPISDAIILFSHQGPSIVGFYTIYSGAGATAGQYNISIMSDVLVPTEADLGDFKFDLEIQWDSAQSPYYRNRTAIELTASIDAIWGVLQSEAPQPSSVQITDWVYVIVTYSDFDHGVGIDGIPTSILDVTYNTLAYRGIVPQGLNIVSLGNGQYNISFNTRDIDTFGNIVLNITAHETFYTTSEVRPSFTVIEINTYLDAVDTEIIEYWSADAGVTVSYLTELYGNETTGASVNWTWGIYSGSFAEIGSSGVYQAFIPTDLYFETGTKTVLISADAPKYQLSTISVTLIILPLPSDMTVATPEEVFSHPRGDEIDVVVYLNDTMNGVLINESRITDLYITFNNTIYLMNWNSTDNSWYYTLPRNATGVLLPNFIYSGRITAEFDVYDPVSFVFKIDLLATKTFLEYYGATHDKMNVVYSDIVTFELNYTEVTGSEINMASVFWSPEGSDIMYNFTSIGGGFWSLSLNSTAFDRWGTFGITFSGIPDDPNLDSAFKSLTVTITRIPTEVVEPNEGLPIDFVWGWQGNISFFFNDTHFDRGIGNATVRVTFDIDTILFDLGNGTYSIYIDTTQLEVLRYRLRISFTIENYDEQNSGIDIVVNTVPTEIQLGTPEMNWDDGDSTDLLVPFGDSVRISLFYNDTDFSEGYVGGLSGATYVTSIYGGGVNPAIPVSFILNDLGNGTYVYTFDSLNEDLYPLYEGIPQALPGTAFSITILIEMDHRESRTVFLTIEVIRRPTTFIVSSDDVSNNQVSLFYGDTLVVYFDFEDDWSSTRGSGIDDANITVTLDGYGLNYTYRELTDGRYEMTIVIESPIVPLGIGDELSILTIRIEKPNYDEKEITLTVSIYLTETQQTLNTVISFGSPLLFLVLLIGLAWIRVFSIPKRLRQINGQIKALRKGKMPKPIDEAKTRQELVAELYNDTNKDLEITRDASMMPLESIPVEVPEMGEILIQLSILTHLSPEELDEFKADISKMKMSEQAAFVKEVIHQEAIRAARRDGKTIEQVLEDVSAEASARLRGAEETAIISEEIRPEERIFLTEDETGVTPDTVDKTEEEKVDIAREIRTEEPVSITEKLSDYEIEELRKDLQAKGVEPHEIDTIIEQARELPRDLVDELIKSLDVGE
jgi:hypothetical protein